MCRRSTLLPHSMLFNGRSVSNLAKMHVQDGGAMQSDGSSVAKLEMRKTTQLCCRSLILFSGHPQHCCLILTQVRVIGSSCLKSFARRSVDIVSVHHCEFSWSTTGRERGDEGKGRPWKLKPPPSCAACRGSHRGVAGVEKGSWR